MMVFVETTSRKEPETGGAFESFPLTRPEYINAMVHFYRGEMYRSQIWRTRLDNTTNWAVVMAAGMISFAFSSPDHSPVTLLLANLVISIFMIIEARRYRYFSVFRARVRMIEENFYLPMIRRNLVSPMEGWRDRVAQDLDAPKFKNTYIEALLFRLRRNYAWLFGIILAAAAVKVFIHPTPAQRWSDILSRMQLGPIPAWAVIMLGTTFYLLVTVPLLTKAGQRAAQDEVGGLERDLSQWKV